MLVKTTFDFRDDSYGRDPDKYSPTLRAYHKHLWSKPLPNGTMFTLDDAQRGVYLHHRSKLGEFSLSSDSVIPTFTRYKRLACLMTGIRQEERDEFLKLSYTIGGMIIFPSDRRNGKMTINGGRGFNQKIADRFDLTLECIRRFYLGETSPLYSLLSSYADFFSLFQTFRDYVDFFLLQDLVAGDYSAIRFATRFDNFLSSPIPNLREEYLIYKEDSTRFIQGRNQRILDFTRVQNAGSS